MRSPLDSYAPEPDHHPSMGPPGGDRFPWLQWLHLAITSALVVVFINQLVQLQDVNRKIARLYERMDNLDQSRMMDTTPALEAQQRTILGRLQELESRLREAELERAASSPSASSSERGPASLQAPPPPSAP
jgi:hypothetical protein